MIYASHTVVSLDIRRMCAREDQEQNEPRSLAGLEDQNRACLLYCSHEINGDVFKAEVGMSQVS